MKMTDAFPSEFLKSGDIGGIDGQDIKARISEVKPWKAPDGKIKLMVSFIGAKKSLLCNITNAKTIARAYGDETDLWIDQPVILFVTMVDFRGDQVEAIRVRIPAPTASQRAQQTTAPIRVGSPSVATPGIIGVGAIPGDALAANSGAAIGGQFDELNPPPHPGPSGNSLDDEIPF